MTQFYNHKHFPDFGGDPTLQSLFRTAELGPQCLNNEDLEPKNAAISNYKF